MRFWSFRPILLVWSVVLAASAAIAIGAQVTGPTPTGTDGGRPAPRVIGRPSDAGQPVLRPAPPAVPAHLQPSSAHPAPQVTMTATSIPDPDPTMMEPNPDFADRMLPRPSGDRRPRQFYAAAFDPAERHPRVALVLDGVGLDRALAQQAMSTLPSAIDFAFSAYAPHEVAAALAQAARAQGRECLVSIPMEPSGYPAAEEGTRALLTGADRVQNGRNLDWALSGTDGCVGATGASDGLAGERFAGSADGYAELLATIDHHGLLYLDPRPGAAPPEGEVMPSAAGHAAPHHGFVRVADLVVDGATASGEPADAQAIDRHLDELAQDAARRGSAIGVSGPPSPVLLDRIAIWAHGLAARGIVLAPLTALPLAATSPAAAAP